MAVTYLGQPPTLPLLSAFLQPLCGENLPGWSTKGNPLFLTSIKKSTLAGKVNSPLKLNHLHFYQRLTHASWVHHLLSSSSAYFPSNPLLHRLPVSVLPSCWFPIGREQKSTVSHWLKPAAERRHHIRRLFSRPLISKPTHIVPPRTTIIPAKTTQNWQQKTESTYSLHSALWGKRVSDTPSQRGRSHPENIYQKHVSFLIPILGSILFDSWIEKEQVTATCYIMNSINSVRHTRSSTQKCVW